MAVCLGTVFEGIVVGVLIGGSGVVGTIGLETEATVTGGRGGMGRAGRSGSRRRGHHGRSDPLLAGQRRVERGPRGGTAKNVVVVVV